MPPAKLSLHYRYMVFPFQYGLVYLCLALYQNGELSHYERFYLI